jgi:hypothetical protein
LETAATVPTVVIHEPGLPDIVKVELTGRKEIRSVESAATGIWQETEDTEPAGMDAVMEIELGQIRIRATNQANPMLLAEVIRQIGGIQGCTPAHAPDGVVHTDSRSLLSGLLYCADCGTRLYFSHNTTTKKMADGTKRKYERDMYRCYRKLSSRKTCGGPSAYNAERLNDAVDTEIRKHLARLGSISEEDLLKAACSQNADLYEVAYRQAEEEFQKASRQVAALEEETVKALTGESQLDLGVVNGMLLKHRAKLEECQRTMEEAKAKKEAEAENNKAAQAQVKEMLTWVERYDKASVEAKHMIIAALVDRIEIGENYEIHIQFKVSAEQFIRQTA